MAIQSLVAPLALWATWLVWVSVFTGVGLLVRSAIVRTRELTGEALFAAFWTGLASATLFLLLLNFVLPINGGAAAAVVLTGAIGLAVHIPALLRGLARAGRLRVYSTLAVLALVGVWCGLHGIQEVAGFDTHMYLVPVVEWIKALPVPPGLANLQERYGFNQATLPLAAMLESGPWVAASPHLLNGIFATALLLRIAGSLSNWPGHTPGDRARRFYDLVMIAPVLALVAAPVQFRALDADIAATLSILAGLSLMIGPIFEDRDGAPDSFLAAGLALTLSALFKLSTASVAVPVWLVLFGLCVRSPKTRMFAIKLAGASGALALVWMARGVVLSGYPLYPNHVVSIPVDWRVPREQVDASTAWVLYFAKTHYAPSQYNNANLAIVCGSLSWIGQWFRFLLTSAFWWRIPLPIAFAAVVAVAAMFNTQTRAALRATAPVATMIGLGGIIWFAISPRPDLGVPFAWGLAGVIAASLGAGTAGFAVSPAISRMVASVSLVAGAALAALPLVGEFVHQLHAHPDRGVSGAYEVLVPTVPDGGLGVTQWEFPSIRYRTASGLELLRPGFHRCSRAPIPCTSHPATNLRLREEGNLRRGFVVDGEWKAERYPNPNSDFLTVWRAAQANGDCTPGLRTSVRTPNFRIERKFMET